MRRYALCFLIGFVSLNAAAQAQQKEDSVHTAEKNSSRSAPSAEGKRAVSLSAGSERADVNISGDSNTTIQKQKASDEVKASLMNAIEALRPVEEKIEVIDRKIKVLEERLKTLSAP